MDLELLRELGKITEEEKILREGNTVDKELYASSRSFEVDAGKLLEKGKLITLRGHTRFAPFPRHSHNYIEIMYMCSGQTTHVINGTATVTLKAGELLFLNRHAGHAISKAEVNDIAVNFIVLPQFFEEALQMLGAENVMGRFLADALQNGSEEISYLHFCVAKVLPIQNLVENMVYSLLHSEPNARKINKISMGLLLLHLLNYTETLEDRHGARQGNPMVLAALREIEENCQDACLTQVAQKYGVSVSYLSTRIKLATGSTFKELLQQKRLDKAMRLLRDTKLTVQEIINTVGYNNTGFFYRIFELQMGVSPKEYRNGLCKPTK